MGRGSKEDLADGGNPDPFTPATNFSSWNWQDKNATNLNWEEKNRFMVKRIFSPKYKNLTI